MPTELAPSILAVALLVLGASCLLQTRRWLGLLRSIFEQPERFFLGALVELLIGLTLAMTYNRWDTTWPAFTTLLGWLMALEGAGGRLSAVGVADAAGNLRRIEADALLPFFGLAQALGPIADWVPELTDGHVVVDPATAMTALPGLFAIGDVSTYPGKLKLILTGFAEAARAAYTAHGVVFPGKRLKFEYSTTKGIPRE